MPIQLELVQAVSSKAAGAGHIHNPAAALSFRSLQEIPVQFGKESLKSLHFQGRSVPLGAVTDTRSLPE